MSGKQNRPEFFIPRINDEDDGYNCIVASPSVTIPLSQSGRVYGVVTISSGYFKDPALAQAAEVVHVLVRLTFCTLRDRSSRLRFGLRCEYG